MNTVCLNQLLTCFSLASDCFQIFPEQISSHCNMKCTIPIVTEGILIQCCYISGEMQTKDRPEFMPNMYTQKCTHMKSCPDKKFSTSIFKLSHSNHVNAVN